MSYYTSLLCTAIDFRPLAKIIANRYIIEYTISVGECKGNYRHSHEDIP